MRQSKLFTKTKKEFTTGEESINAKLLIKAGFIDKLMAGVYTFLPLGLLVLNKIENIIREEINKIDGQEILMPSLQPKENWIKTNRWDAMDYLYKVKDLSDREFALGPTHEEIIVPLVKKFVNSYKDFPLAVYQFQNKFRMELRAKSGLLRGREFIMKDLYSFHLNEKCFESYYEKAKQAYFKIFERVGLKEQTYYTFASGGTFSKYSHEFQTVTPAGEDTIYICQKCRLAINKEVKQDMEKCPDCQSNDFKEEKSIEVGNIFPLKTKYSKPFDLMTDNERGEKIEVLMGCYGIGLGRLLGTVTEVYHDTNGITWPGSIAPFKYHLLNLSKNKVNQKLAEKIYQILLDKGEEIFFDDREETSAGEKLKDADLIGIPYRLVISDKTDGKIEIKKRDESLTKLITINEL
jgi:prolyl-tRNA synthetase